MLTKFLPAVLICCMAAAFMSSCAKSDLGKQADSVASEADFASADTVEMAPPNKTTGETPVSVAAPEGWTKKDDESAILWYEKGTAYLNVVQPWIPADAKSAADVAKYEYLQMKGSFQEAEVSEPVETRIDGFDASRVEVNIAVSEDSTQKQVYIYFFRDGAAYQVMGACLTNNAQDSSDIESMIQSIKFK